MCDNAIWQAQLKASKSCSFSIIRWPQPNGFLNRVARRSAGHLTTHKTFHTCFQWDLSNATKTVKLKLNAREKNSDYDALKTAKRKPNQTVVALTYKELTKKYEGKK